MSKSNENNRPQGQIRIGAISATAELGLMKADKKVILQKISVTDISVISADGTNHYQFQLKKNGSLIGSVVDNQAGLAARASLDLNLGTDTEKELASGDYLSLQITEVGAGAVLSEAACDWDYLVKGN